MHLEVDTKDDKTDSHDGAALEEEDLPAGAFDEQRRNVSGDGLDDADYDGGNSGRDVGAGGLEDVVGVEDNGVDAAELLEEHEAEGADQRLTGAAARHNAADSRSLAGRVVNLKLTIHKQV